MTNALRSMWAIGLEYARQQKVMLVIFAFWILGFDLVLALVHKGDDPSDFGAMYQQQSLYGIVFVVFMASSLLQTERNSRRVLAILSKAISRFEYLGGHIVGLTLLLGLYYVSATGMYWLLGWQFGFETHAAAMLIAGLLISSLGAAVALFIGTWAHPLASAGLAMLVLMVPLLVFERPETLVAAPAAYYLKEIFTFEPTRGFTCPPAFWIIAVIETVAAWLAAAFIFERKDIAVPTE